MKKASWYIDTIDGCEVLVVSGHPVSFTKPSETTKPPRRHRTRSAQQRMDDVQQSLRGDQTNWSAV